MKVTVSQQQLAHGLGIVSRAVSTRSTLPVLANVLVATDEGRLRLSATDLELGITCWVGAQIQEEGSVTVPARTFADLINALPNDLVSLDLNNNNQTLRVRCLQSFTDIKGIDAQEFPPMPVPGPNDGIELNVSTIKEMIQQVAFAASSDEARPVLQGVSLTVSGKDITLAATDGFRISVRKSTLDEGSPAPMTAIIPARALNELARIATDGEQKMKMIVPPGRGQAIFHLKDAELASQLIDGNFPDYKAIVPRSFKNTTILTTAAFLKACKQAEIIARDSNNVVRLDIEPGGEQPGRIEIRAVSEETGSSENSIDASVEGPAMKIAFNVRFLREVLEVIKSPSVILLTNASNTPGMVQPAGDEDFKHVIMPMHLG